MNEFTANVETTVEDWRAFLQRWQRTVSARYRSPWWSLLVNIALWAIIGFAFAWLYKGIHYPTAAVVSAVFLSGIASGYLIFLRIRKAAEPNLQGVFLGKHSYVFSPRGIEIKGKGYSSNMSWDVIQSVDETNDLLILYVDSSQAIVLPKRCLDNPDALRIFIQERTKNEA
jgi:hypothetical protein